MGGGGSSIGGSGPGCPGTGSLGCGGFGTVAKVCMLEPFRGERRRYVQWNTQGNVRTRSPVPRMHWAKRCSFETFTKFGTDIQPSS
jgi:hypothetical protein